MIKIENNIITKAYDEKDLVIPENITYIESNVFSYDDCIRSINLSNCEIIQNKTFSNSLIKEVIGENIKRINLDSFLNCYELKSARFPNCEMIGRGVFNNCFNLNNIEIGKCKIKNNAFSGCINLKNINFENIIELGIATFHNCGFSEVNIPGHIKNIPELCFSDNRNLINVILNEGVEELQLSAFNNCDIDIYIPSTLTKIYDSYLINLKINNIYYNGKFEDFKNIKGYKYLRYNNLYQTSFEELVRAGLSFKKINEILK